MEFFTKIKKIKAEIEQKAQEIVEEKYRERIKNHIFARNAPKNSLEAKILDELLAAHQEWEAIPIYEFRKKKLAKKKLDEAAAKALQAHQDFLARGEKYVTRRGKIIA